MQNSVTSQAMALNIATSLIGQEQVQTINARELHEKLGSRQDFSDWIKNRIETYGFVDWEDFTINLWKNNSRGRPQKNYILTLDTAKEIAMVENNEQGRKIRKYLIQIEKEYRENFSKNSQPLQNSRLAQQGFAIPNFALMNDDIGQFWLAVWQWLARVQEMMTEQNEQLILAKNLLAEQHELINTLTQENAQTAIENHNLKKENHHLKSNPIALMAKWLELATGREVQLSIGKTLGDDIENTHTTIKWFCAEHKIKLNQWDSIKFATIVKKLCKEAGEMIEKIPDSRYGTLNIYPRYLLASAVQYI